MSVTFILRPIAILPAVSSLAVILTTIIYILKGKKTILLQTFIFFNLSMFAWNFGQAIQCISSNNETTFFSIYLIHIALCFTGVTWLLFCFAYLGKMQKLITLKTILLFIPPLINYTLFLTHPLHSLYFKELRYDPEKILIVSYGPIFWFTTAISYIYGAIGIILFIHYYFKKSSPGKYQIFLLTLSAAIILIVSMVSVFIIVTKGKGTLVFFDFTPSCFTFSILIFSIAAFKYRFLCIYPEALLKIIDNMKESVLVIDNLGIIINYNPAFANAFGDYAHVRAGDEIGGFTEKLKEFITDNYKDKSIIDDIVTGTGIDMTNGDITLKLEKLYTYQVTVLNILDKRRKYLGKIITFNDVTKFKELLEELSSKNNKLITVNQKLSEYLKVVEELTIANERNRVARKMHDTLGHTLTLLIMIMKECRIKLESEANIVKGKLSEGIRIAIEGLEELRRTVRGLVNDKTAEQSIISRIERIIKSFKNTDVHIEFKVIGEENIPVFQNTGRRLELSDAINMICMEAITNSIKHGSPTKIDILLRFQENQVQLFVFDNGKGCKSIKEGFGLSSIKQRVKDMNGNFKYGSDGELGFNIHIKIPVGDEDDKSPDC